jgi:hypothetical protein
MKKMENKSARKNLIRALFATFEGRDMSVTFAPILCRNSAREPKLRKYEHELLFRNMTDIANSRRSSMNNGRFDVVVMRGGAHTSLSDVV